MRRCANDYGSRVFHFDLLIGRCYAYGPVSRIWDVQVRIAEEEQMLLVLMERRRWLLKETEELEGSREAINTPLPTVLDEGVHFVEENGSAEIREGEDLIDTSTSEHE